MTGRSASILIIRAASIVGLIAVGMAVAMIAWQERLTATNPAFDPAWSATVAGHLRIVLFLLLLAAAAVVLVTVLVARMAPFEGDRAAAAQQVAEDTLPEAPSGELAATPALALP